MQSPLSETLESGRLHTSIRPYYADHHCAWMGTVPVVCPAHYDSAAVSSAASIVMLGPAPTAGTVGCHNMCGVVDTEGGFKGLKDETMATKVCDGWLPVESEMQMRCHQRRGRFNTSYAHACVCVRYGHRTWSASVFAECMEKLFAHCSDTLECEAALANTDGARCCCPFILPGCGCTFAMLMGEGAGTSRCSFALSFCRLYTWRHADGATGATGPQHYRSSVREP